MIKLINTSEDEVKVTRIYLFEKTEYLLTEIQFRRNPYKDPLRIIMKKEGKDVITLYQFDNTPEFFKFLNGYMKNQVRKSLGL
jgi:hypothetical protein